MPHKHTRREKDPSTFDLPPSQIARPLPVTAPSRKNAPASKANAESTAPKKGVKRKRENAPGNDAPRAFKRLMAFAGGKKFRSGLDDGSTPEGKKGKKGKKSKAAKDAQQPKPAEPALEIPKIKPGERMSDFSARVDAALPLGGLVHKTPVKNGRDPMGVKVRRTKKERQMHKLYAEWREEEERIKEKKEEERELVEEMEMEKDETFGVSWRLDFQEAATTGKKKKKGKTGAGDDPWEELKRKRGQTKSGLHDVVGAPPELTRINVQKFKLRRGVEEVESIPKAAGDLERRKELQGVRKDVVATYRKMVEARRAKVDDEESA